MTTKQHDVALVILAVIVLGLFAWGIYDAVYDISQQLKRECV